VPDYAEHDYVLGEGKSAHAGSGQVDAEHYRHPHSPRAPQNALAVPMAFPRSTPSTQSRELDLDTFVPRGRCGWEILAWRRMPVRGQANCGSTWFQQVQSDAESHLPSSGIGGEFRLARTQFEFILLGMPALCKSARPL